MTAPLHVAIDGPAGSGKSTVARKLAEHLGFLHVDTGAMYRTLALRAARAGVDVEDGARLAAMLKDARIVFDPEGRVHLDDEDVSAAIRTPEITAAVSQVSAHAAVRAEMVRRQRDACWDAVPGAVMEGRDIGSVVLPLAQVKLHLLATAEERARRRAAQMGLDETEIPRIQAEIEERDHRDSTRAESPLLVSPDARVIDTTDLDVGQVVERCVALVGSLPRTETPEAAVDPYRFFHRRYRFFHGLVSGFFRVVFGLRVYGAAHQRVLGSVIFASNHVSWNDPPVVGSAIGREVWYLAKRELFIGPFGALISAFNAIPIVRGRFDRQAFDRANAVLANDRSLLIFPEGTRRPVGHPGPVKRGLGILARESGRPYVPMYLRGTPNLWAAMLRLRSLEVWFGPPVTLHALEHLERSLTEAEINARVGRLYLAQLRALIHLSERGR